MPFGFRCFEFLDFCVELANYILLEFVPANHTGNPSDSTFQFLVQLYCKFVVHLFLKFVENMALQIILYLLCFLNVDLVLLEDFFQVKSVFHFIFIIELLGIISDDIVILDYFMNVLKNFVPINNLISKLRQIGPLEIICHFIRLRCEK